MIEASLVYVLTPLISFAVRLCAVERERRCCAVLCIALTFQGRKENRRRAKGGTLMKSAAMGGSKRFVFGSTLRGVDY